MLDTRFTHYQYAIIGTVLTTLHAGSVLLTFYPNFNLSLQDTNLSIALKVQVQIQGAEQISSAKITTLHHQLVYRLQNHALDLPSPEHHSDALMVLAESDQIPTIIQIPRQIPRHELIQLMPLEWISNYEKFHTNTSPIQTIESMFERRSDGTVQMTFRPPPTAPKEPPRLSFTYSAMVTAVQTAQEKLPITGFNSKGYPVYPAKLNGHFLWDSPGSGNCDPDCPCWDDWEEDDVEPQQRRKPKKKIPKTPCSHNQPKPPHNPPPTLALLPIYQKELRWIAKNCKIEVLPHIQNSKPPIQPKACMIFSSTSQDYSSNFPDLETQTDPQRKVNRISVRTDHIESTMDSITSQMQQIYQNLQSRISQLDLELRTMLSHRYYGPKFDQKEKEIRKLKAELEQIELERQRPTLFTTSPPLPTISPAFHPFAHMLSPIKPHDPSKLFGITHTLFRNNPLPKPSRSKPHPRPRPEKQPFQPPLSIPKQQRSLYTPLPPQPTPTQAKDKSPMQQYSAQIIPDPFDTDQTSDSNLVVSEDPFESETKSSLESSISSSDSEKSYADITRILMAQPEETEPAQSSRTYPFFEIPSDIEEGPPKASSVPNWPAQPPNDHKPSNGPWFTFDDILAAKWRDRLSQMATWTDLQLLRANATTTSVLRELATRFTGSLIDLFDTLGEYRQLQFVQLPNVSTAFSVIHDQFIGESAVVFEAARRDYLNMKCCSLNSKDLDFHYNDPTLKHVFLASLPEELQPDIQRQLTSLNLTTDNISLGKIFQIAKGCLEKLYEIEFYFSEQEEPTDETVFAQQNSSDDSENDEFQTVFHQQLLSLDTTIPIPSIKLQILPSKFQRPIPAIGLPEPKEPFQDISTKLLKYCPESHTDFHHPNPLWKNPHFFVQLPFKLNEDVNPTKATHPGMSPFDLVLAQKECSQLLAQGLIEPSSSQWLSALLKKNPPSWNNNHTLAVTMLKQIAQNPPPLKLITDGRRILQTDASDESWGTILLEETDGKEHFIAYASGHFFDTKIHYHSVFKEILAVKHGIQKFEYHLIGYHFLVRMDNSAFPNIMNFKGKNVPEKMLLRLKDWFKRRPQPYS
ncbi:hypothetical protein KPL71_004192 [Citrus sinensis]|uniref:Uncharacterized protein n=1 Tax=Citrus sinensis TaxID=2711 RepID=A0ACB8N3Y4_CITSI|nr:hypothetical protein KPL71_004192 [Citrus sinensis]